MAFCTKCGAQLTEGARFCTTCGSVVENQTQAAPVQQIPVQPAYQYNPAPVAPQAPAKNNTVLWIIVAVVAVIALMIALVHFDVIDLDLFGGSGNDGAATVPTGEPTVIPTIPDAVPMPMPTEPSMPEVQPTIPYEYE